MDLLDELCATGALLLQEGTNNILKLDEKVLVQLRVFQLVLLTGFKLVAVLAKEALELVAERGLHVEAHSIMITAAPCHEREEKTELRKSSTWSLMLSPPSSINSPAHAPNHPLSGFLTCQCA